MDTAVMVLLLSYFLLTSDYLSEDSFIRAMKSSTNSATRIWLHNSIIQTRSTSTLSPKKVSQTGNCLIGSTQRPIIIPRGNSLLGYARYITRKREQRIRFSSRGDLDSQIWMPLLGQYHILHWRRVWRKGKTIYAWILDPNWIVTFDNVITVYLGNQVAYHVHYSSHLRFTMIPGDTMVLLTSGRSDNLPNRDKGDHRVFITVESWKIRDVDVKMKLSFYSSNIRSKVYLQKYLGERLYPFTMYPMRLLPQIHGEV
ncbi:hypothetical protein PENTCL1PPCAC_19720 [Pristionchus entomophagus]|uniref:Uncharacterized protein n=1 Tax=Pristionchus entomophagus TaxID=358040 RepID=A0AAV5TTE4_9BILA|nr:hypothetical protein PENTCL1PPCAC_19720 [Pristionchus entomophagus]